MKIDYLRIRDVWDNLEKNYQQPKFLNKIIEIEWTHVRENILKLNYEWIKEIISSLYEGNVFVLKNAYCEAECEYIREMCTHWAEHEPEQFFKTLDGCKDFHQKINAEQASKLFYSFQRIQHHFYSYRWNGDKYNLFDIADKTWPYFKAICGWNMNAFEKNIPSDKVVDRLHIHHYPRGIGQQELHSDPPSKQKFIQGFLLSKPGVDYQSGGICYITQGKERFFVDKLLNQGDGYISYPTLMHSVELIDAHEAPDWNCKYGRWFMGFYSMDSDYVLNRGRGWPEKM
jgi:hypothetical protein